MKIIQVKTSDIKPYENNPRQNDEAVEFVASSIKQFGFKQPIIIDKDNIIIAGHTRHKAARVLNLETVPCVMADDMTPEQVRAYRLADNKVAEFSVWDMDKLRDELSEISGINMDELGFGDISDMLDTDGLFNDADNESTAGEPDMVTCPDCGEVFEA